MKLVVFGLSISSSWGNGHATLWRGLCRALGDQGHEVVFFERDTPYYASHRDSLELPGLQLCLYTEWAEVLPQARAHMASADAAMVTSYCPDGVAATEEVLGRDCDSIFYDLDTPITLQRLAAGDAVSYIGPRGLVDFDLVLTYTGGQSIEDLQTVLGAREVQALYGSVDPGSHYPVDSVPRYAADVSYLGTYSDDRQAALDMLFLEPSRRRKEKKFLIGGALYPQSFPWSENIYFVRHLPPSEHPAFYCSSPLTVNVTRKAMADTGYCPSARLFEAAACGVPVLSDWWPGLDEFFEPEREILIARDAAKALSAIERPLEELAEIGARARRRVCREHTAAHRARQLVAMIEGIYKKQRSEPCGA